MPKPTTSAASLAAGGLAVIAVAVLAGCGQARVSGIAEGSAGSHAPSRQSGSSQPRAGQQGAGQPGSVTAALLCTDPAAVTEVRVVRTPSLSQLGQTKPLRTQIPGITVRDPAAARSLAMAICALPALPHAVFDCPVDVGGGYALEFMSGGHQFHPVMVHASGCEDVTGGGAGGARWVVRTPGFWTTLAQLTGIRAPAHSP
jgi:hypothetical protein